MKTSEVRQSFLNFFKSKGHTIVESYSLVPHGDPTLMFTNAGMNQFKDCFLGADKREYTRATTSQKVMRISGKHNDFENVGVTARHHTFFEMLGNFSFGDYFKKDAISFAWEYITEVLKLDKKRLWVTIHDSDDEAKELWIKETGISADRILKLGDEDNFWAMGDTGPCGPCTEIHYYLGDINTPQTAEWFLKGDGAFLEIWNLVFMQYNRQDGKLNPLPKPSVDTGMGLERIAAVMQGKTSNYDIDLMRNIIAKAEAISGFKYDGTSYEPKDLLQDKQYARDVAMRVLADHSRSMTFIVADGVMPSSEGRGYILRRLIRRAIRHGRVLECKKPILAEICKTVIELMSDAYPDLKERQEHVLKVVDAEERKFHETLELGLNLLTKEVSKAEGGKLFSGKTAFTLHDTYGFPLDLTEDALKSYKIKVDVDEFNREMQQQKQRGREDRKSQKISYQAQSFSFEKTKFLGYQKEQAEAKLLELIPSESSDQAALIFDETPFYAESGGQVGDTGEIEIEGNRFEVLDTQKSPSGHIVHSCVLVSGEFSPALKGKKATLKVDSERRKKIKAHHSATHILHYALRTVLGDHVKQAGSRVDDNSFRFDYNHYEPVSEQQLKDVQAIVTKEILANNPIEIKEMDIDAAKAMGAMALFGEKYGKQVRVVKIGNNSIELCGGTHANASGELGTVLIQSEGGIAAGVRRIECIAGAVANQQILEERSDRAQALSLIKGDGDSITSRVEKLLARNKELEKELESSKAKLAGNKAEELLAKASISPAGFKVIKEMVESDSNALRDMVDNLKVKLGSSVIALANAEGSLVVGVSSDLSSKFNAGKLVKEAAILAGGKGGGRADFAQAGGLDKSKMNLAFDKIEQLVSA